MESPIIDSFPNPEVTTGQGMARDNNIDNQIWSDMEMLIQTKYQVFVPALYFEYKPANLSSDFKGWDYDDLWDFFSNFGEVDTLDINGRIAIILFKCFIDAYAALEYLKSSNNLKEEEKNNLNVRWYNQRDESIIFQQAEQKFMKLKPNRVIDNLSHNSTNSNEGYMSINPYKSPEKPFANAKQQYNYYSSYTLKPQARAEFNDVMQVHKHNKNHWNNEEEKCFSHADKSLSSGKYTCKFEIMIENDTEFQVARRIIGAKGCNMKKVVDLCSRDKDGNFIPDAVKLRLRGRGSGYKEGPYNRESDEPLHLCISSKYQDKYKKACSYVQELIINVYEEHKRFCERKGKRPLYNMNIQKEESISSRRGGSNPHLNE